MMGITALLSLCNRGQGTRLLMGALVLSVLCGQLCGTHVQPANASLQLHRQHARFIGTCTPQGQIMEYTLPTPRAQPNSIVLGPDGKIWFTELGSNALGQVVSAAPGKP